MVSSVLRWESDGSPASLTSLASLAAHRQLPLIIEGVDLRRRPHDDVDEAWLASLGHLGCAAQVSLSPSLTYYAHDKPLASVRGFDAKRRGTSAVANVSGEQLVSRLRELAAARAWEDAADGDHGQCAAVRWWYLSARNGSAPAEEARRLLQLERLEQAAIAAARVHSSVGALAPAREAVRAGDEAEAKVNLWVGGSDVTSSCHYDASYNVFAQLRGHKRFTLAPPSDFRHLHPLSFHHPHFRRSQQQPIDVSDTRVIIADLSPGDVLLLPPFWWHRVSATANLSLSANAWATGAAVSASQRLVDAPAHAFRLNAEGGPLNGHAWDNHSRAALAELLSTDVTQQVLGVSNEASRAFLAEQMAVRWAPVLHMYPKPMRRLARFCATAAAATRRTLASVQMHARPSEDDNKPRFASAVQRAAAILHALPAGSMELVLCDLVEALALALLGDVKTTGSFLTHCFA